MDSYILLVPVTLETAIRLLEAMVPCGPSQVTLAPLEDISMSTAAFRVMLQRRVVLDGANIGGSTRTEGMETAYTEKKIASCFTTVCSVHYRAVGSKKKPVRPMLDYTLPKVCSGDQSARSAEIFFRLHFSVIRMGTHKPLSLALIQMNRVRHGVSIDRTACGRSFASHASYANQTDHG